jgi:hypothetical protein
MGVVVGVDEARQDEVSAPVELFDRRRPRPEQSPARWPAMVSPAMAMSAAAGACQLPAGSIGRPPRMISVVPVGSVEVTWEGDVAPAT